jgi:hypothetical protein
MIDLLEFVANLTRDIGQKPINKKITFSWKCVETQKQRVGQEIENN